MVDKTVAPAGSPFAGMALARPLWPHQEKALAAFEEGRNRHAAATYLVVPPGGGKTLIGLEAVRRLGRPAVVLCPNTAIQAQWAAQWQTAFTPPDVAATTSRELPTALTVLTYQAVCTLDHNGNRPAAADGAPGSETEGETSLPNGSTRRHAAARDDLLDLLHPAGLALIDRMQASGPLTLVLDECHHLLEMWGSPSRQDHRPAERAARHRPHRHPAAADDRRPVSTPPISLRPRRPGGFRPRPGKGRRLAPYQELAYLTRPTPAEGDYIHARRSASSRSALTCSTRPSRPPRSSPGCRPAWWTGPATTVARCPGQGSSATNPAWPPRPFACTPPVCSRSQKAPVSASSTGTRRPPPTGWR